MKSLFALLLTILCVAPFAGEYSLEVSLGLLGLGALAYHFAPSGVLFNIPVQDARGIFTKGLISVYKEKTTVTSFLRSFFTPVESMTKEVSIAVRRGTEKVATDVVRYSDGNRNTFDKSSEKLFVPPLYHEYLTANDHRLYDQVITALAEGNTTYFAEMTAELAEDLMELQNKIERAVELQCAQIMQTGIITLNSNTDIDFKRKAASIVAYNAANDFSVNTVDPSAVIRTGCEFIRQKGKSQGGTFNSILGGEALNALINNDIIKERGDVRDYDLMNIREPQRNAVGATLHGQLSCGAYKVNLWTYPEYYDNASGTSTPYIDPKKVIVMPESPKFTLAYAAVPQLIENGTIPQRGAYLVQEFMDRKKTAHEIHIKSAPVAIPVAIDQLYTVTVLN
jgi:hypothetical protein